MQRSLYLPSLDGLRFFAFAAVFLHHAPVGNIPFLDVVHRDGWVGVELFFVISAYLFLHLLKAEQEKTGRIDAVRFFGRRILRLYPALLAYSLIALTAAHSMAGLMDFASIASFTKNIAAAISGYGSALPFTSHLWTISFEFQMYLAIPVIFMAWHTHGTRGLYLLLLCIWLIAFAIRLYAVVSGWQHPAVWVLPVTRPESILAGLILATVTFAPRPSFAIGGVLLLAVGIALMPQPGKSSLDMALYPTVAVLCFLVVWLAITWQPLIHILSMTVLRYLGRISYGLYLYHLACLGLTKKAAYLLPEMSPIATSASITTVSLFLTIIVAAGSYQWLELPFLRIKRRISAVESVPV